MNGRIIALGFFDGVHRGHRALLRETVRLGEREDCRPAALTFAGNVAGKSNLLLNSLEDRRMLMQRLCGVEEMLVLAFDEALMRMEPKDFVEMLVQRFGAVHLVAGYDFTYGYRGAGNAETLKTQCAELRIGCTILPAVEAGGEAISSRMIRGLVTGGEMEEAVSLLGHPHVLTAPVEHGYRLGHTMGYPTANQVFPKEVAVPAKGVYAARVILPDGRAYFGAANIGTRPTVSDGNAVTLETHILDFSENLYGKTIRTELFARLRPEMRFESKEALFCRIGQDGENVRAWFAENRSILLKVEPELVRYAEETLLPLYDGFDKGHDGAHVREVTENAMELAAEYDLDPSVVYCMAVYHDLGMTQGRKTHHLTSAKLLREDEMLKKWFSAKQREIMAQAVEDHRASGETPPRSLYGRLLCDADRCLEPETVVRRTLDFGAANYPGLTEEEQFARLKAHLAEKYSEDGYLTLQLGAKKTVSQLAALRDCIRDEARLKALFEDWLKQNGQIG